MVAQEATQACPVYYVTLSRARPCCCLDDAVVLKERPCFEHMLACAGEHITADSAEA